MNGVFSFKGIMGLIGLMVLPLAAEQVADLGRDGIDIKVDAEPAQVDVARDFFVTLTFTVPSGRTIALPDLRDRFTGFRVAEDFTEDPVAAPDGSTMLVSRWRLVPEPVAPSTASPHLSYMFRLRTIFPPPHPLSTPPPYTSRRRRPGSL
ncbi:MAG: hypothetical protein IKO72_05025 [Kiritimatiellae bacterium]|nr:hypothetical protein [Kiritimatiellia bacterium]